MNYDELIAMALKGRSVNSMAKAWGLPQPTLDSYVKGKAMPDFDTALKIAREAGAPEKEAWEALAERTRIHRASKFKLQHGFARTQLVAATALAALTVNLFLTPPTAKAAPAMNAQPTSSLAINYAKFVAALRRIRAALYRTIFAQVKRLFVPTAFESTTG